MYILLIDKLDLITQLQVIPKIEYDFANDCCCVLVPNWQGVAYETHSGQMVFFHNSRSQLEHYKITLRFSFTVCPELYSYFPGVLSDNQATLTSIYHIKAY